MAYEDLNIFREIAKEQGADIITPVFADQLVMDFRTTYKCRTCPKYGKKPTCPPNIPDFEYFQRLIRCYRYGLIIGKTYRYSSDAEYEQMRKESSPRLQNILFLMEEQAFQRNYYWAISFIGGSCRGCDHCPMDGSACVNPVKGRIPMEAIGVNVFDTCKQLGIGLSPFPFPTTDNPLFRIGLFMLE